jgi:hypothetical protein
LQRQKLLLYSAAVTVVHVKLHVLLLVVLSHLTWRLQNVYNCYWHSIWGQSYKFFVISLSFCPWQAFAAWSNVCG